MRINRATIRHLPIVLCIVATATSCGQQLSTRQDQPSSSPSPTPATTVSPSPEAAASKAPLFAVLEVRRRGVPANTSAWPDTIALANSQGYAVARASFSPRSGGPQIFDAAVVGQPQAVVAAGAVYYADSLGVIRRLDPSGSVRQVAKFALTSNDQEISLAVSPDGTQLIAARLTFPHLIANPSPGPNEGPVTPVGNWVLELLKAESGTQAVTTLGRWQAPATTFPNGPGAFTNLVIVGWDSGGPIALVGSEVGTQQGFPGERFFGGHLAHLDGSGKAGLTIGGADCSPESLPVANRVTSLSIGSSVVVSVRSLDGTVLRNLPDAASVGVLSADGGRVATQGRIVTVASGASLSVPTTFTPTIWLDGSTLIGSMPDFTTVAALRLLPSVRLENWGFSGQVVGVVD
jgi:hypothetical protein